jgi:hypothetical protein
MSVPQRKARRTDEYRDVDNQPKHESLFYSHFRTFHPDRNNVPETRRERSFETSESATSAAILDRLWRAVIGNVSNEYTNALCSFLLGTQTWWFRAFEEMGRTQEAKNFFAQ